MSQQNSPLVCPVPTVSQFWNADRHAAVELQSPPPINVYCLANAARISATSCIVTAHSNAGTCPSSTAYRPQCVACVREDLRSRKDQVPRSTLCPCLMRTSSHFDFVLFYVPITKRPFLKSNPFLCTYPMVDLCKLRGALSPRFCTAHVVSINYESAVAPRVVF